MNIRNTIFALSIVVAAAVFAPVYGPVLLAAAGDDLNKDMKTVADVFSLVEKHFADPVSSEKAFWGDQGGSAAIPGMPHTLAPHSNFVEPAEYREMQRRQHAQYYGVGMSIMSDSPYRAVGMEPFAESPASTPDLRRGDVIAAVDGKKTAGMDSAAVADLLRGPKGT